MINVSINGNSSTYPIFIEDGLLNNVLKHVQDVFKGEKLFIISDDNVAPLYGATVVDALKNDYKVELVVLPSGETSKNHSNLASMYEKLANFGMTRFDCIIALGGGVIGDFAGFVAATYMRSIPYIQIPTSLLSQVDSSVGSKVAVDMDFGKNIVGAFYDPICVLIDPSVLKTLTNEFFFDGMAEVIKYAFIEDVELYEILKQYHDYDSIQPVLSDVIARCVLCKQRFVEGDMLDKGKRMILNFGHTVAHAIELHYNFEKYSHGHAVAIGMAYITKISESTNQTKEGTYDKVIALLKQYDLPIYDDVNIEVIIDNVLKDKKREANLIHYILIEEIGKSFIYKDSIEYLL